MTLARLKPGALRAAITVRLQTVPGLYVYPWPATATDLLLPAVTVGHPGHQWLDEPLEPDPEGLGAWRWRTVWPVRVYVAATDDRAATDTIDELVGEIVDAFRSDPTLTGEAISAVLADAEVLDDEEDNAGAQQVIAATLVVDSRMTAT